MKYTHSLQKNYQFRYLYQKGKSLANRRLVMIVKKNKLPGNRLGISVSKKVGNSVVRSRVTRLIRESYRLMEEKIKLSFDLVIIARASCNGASFQEINKDLTSLLTRHLLWKDDTTND